MPLTCNWGNTPAYATLAPIWNSITLTDKTEFRDEDEWKNQPAIIHFLDDLLVGPTIMGPPFSWIFSMVRLWKLTEDNAPEFYGRMRTWETLIENAIIYNVGTYDPATGVYTPPESKADWNSLSPWMVAQFIGYSCNWGEQSRKEWVKSLREQPEVEKYTAKYVNECVEKFAEEYRNDPDVLAGTPILAATT